MTYQERQATSSLIAGVIIFAAYFLWLWRAAASGYFDSQDAGRLAGIAICILMVGGIIFTIAFSILFNILTAIINQDPKPSFLVDERDRLLELRAIKYANALIGLGFVACMIGLALGVSFFWTLQFIVIAFAVGSLMESILQLAFYRWSAVP